MVYILYPSSLFFIIFLYLLCIIYYCFRLYYIALFTIIYIFWNIGDFIFLYLLMVYYLPTIKCKLNNFGRTFILGKFDGMLYGRVCYVILDGIF
jgi:hypothetical protein